MTAIVLLPGMDGSGTLFDDFIAALGAKPIVVSYPCDRPLNYEQLAEFVERSLPADEPYLLLGESFSGPIAITLAAKRPQGLRGLILVCTFAMLPPPRPPRALRRLLAALPFWKLPFDLAAPSLLGEVRPPQLDEKLMSAVQRVTAAVWRERMHCVLCVDVRAQAQQICVPVLYLRATRDRVVPAAASEVIVRARPGTRVVSIDGHHALLQTKAVECASAVKRFANECGLTIACQSNTADALQPSSIA